MIDRLSHAMRHCNLVVRGLASLVTAVVAPVVLAAAIMTWAPAHAETSAVGAHKAFVLIEYQVRDKALFQTIREQVRATLKTHKGELVTREKVEPIFGGSPTNISVVGFDSIDAARAWLGSKELAALAPQREKAATVTMYLVEKLD